MKPSLQASAVLLLCLLVACATGGAGKTESSTAPGTDIAADYATFGWRAAGNSAGVANAPVSILDAKVRAAIRSQLVAKGYREVAEDPDLRISFETAPYLAEKVTGSPVRIGVGMGSWGSHVGGGVSGSVPVGREGVTTSSETRLTIRAVDPKQNQEVWLGTTTGLVTAELDASGVDAAVAGTLADFPAREP